MSPPPHLGKLRSKSINHSEAGVEKERVPTNHAPLPHLGKLRRKSVGKNEAAFEKASVKINAAPTKESPSSRETPARGGYDFS